MLAVSCKLQILASEIHQTKFTDVSLVVFFKTISFWVQVKLEPCPCLPLAFYLQTSEEHPNPFILARVPSPHQALVRFIACNQARAVVIRVGSGT